MPVLADVRSAGKRPNRQSCGPDGRRFRCARDESESAPRPSHTNVCMGTAAGVGGNGAGDRASASAHIRACAAWGRRDCFCPRAQREPGHRNGDVAMARSGPAAVAADDRSRPSTPRRLAGSGRLLRREGAVNPVPLPRIAEASRQRTHSRPTSRSERLRRSGSAASTRQGSRRRRPPPRTPGASRSHCPS